MKHQAQNPISSKSFPSKRLRQAFVKLVRVILHGERLSITLQTVCYPNIQNLTKITLFSVNIKSYSPLSTFTFEFMKFSAVEIHLIRCDFLTGGACHQVCSECTHCSSNLYRKLLPFVLTFHACRWPSFPGRSIYPYFALSNCDNWVCSFKVPFFPPIFPLCTHMFRGMFGSILAAFLRTRFLISGSDCVLKVSIKPCINMPEFADQTPASSD